MSEEAPGLLPIFRSENQLRLVGELFVHAERWWTLPGLAEAVGVS